MAEARLLLDRLRLGIAHLSGPGQKRWLVDIMGYGSLNNFRPFKIQHQDRALSVLQGLNLLLCRHSVGNGLLPAHFPFHPKDSCCLSWAACVPLEASASIFDFQLILYQIGKVFEAGY